MFITFTFLPVVTVIVKHLKLSFLFRMHLETYAAPTHGGTHLDAPLQMMQDGWDIADIALERLVDIPIALVDVTLEVNEKSDYVVTADDLLRWEEEHGPLPMGALVVIYTGWGKVSISGDQPSGSKKWSPLLSSTHVIM